MNDISTTGTPTRWGLVILGAVGALLLGGVAAIAVALAIVSARPAGNGIIDTNMVMGALIGLLATLVAAMLVARRTPGAGAQHGLYIGSLLAAAGILGAVTSPHAPDLLDVVGFALSLLSIGAGWLGGIVGDPSRTAS